MDAAAGRPGGLARSPPPQHLQQQRCSAPALTGAHLHQGAPATAGGDAKKWRDAYLELQEEQRRAKSDLGRSDADARAVAAEVAELRDRLAREKAETKATLDHYAKRIEGAMAENKKVHNKLMRTQLRESAMDSEAATVKREVLEKSHAIDQVMRELQQQHMAALSRCKSIANSLLTSCSAPRAGSTAGGGAISGSGYSGAGCGCTVSANAAPSSSLAGASVRRQAFSHSDVAAGSLGRAGSGESLPSRRASLVSGREQRERVLDNAEAALRQDDGLLAMVPGSSSSEAETQRWFQSVKSNLEHFGDVEVFVDASARECSCCLEPLQTQYRIRPRSCNHVFHIECLLQWWTEGTCPVCSVSFAPGSSKVPGAGEAGGAVASMALPSTFAVPNAHPGFASSRPSALCNGSPVLRSACAQLPCSAPCGGGACGACGCAAACGPPAATPPGAAPALFQGVAVPVVRAPPSAAGSAPGPPRLCGEASQTPHAGAPFPLPCSAPGVRPVLSQPAGLPGPGTFGGLDGCSGSGGAASAAGAGAASPTPPAPMASAMAAGSVGIAPPVAPVGAASPGVLRRPPQ